MQEHEYKARDKTVQKMSRDGLREENLRNKEEKRITGRDMDTEVSRSEKRMNWISVREGVSISIKKGKQNIRSKVPKKPDIVENLYWMMSRNKI